MSLNVLDEHNNDGVERVRRTEGVFIRMTLNTPDAPGFVKYSSVFFLLRQSAARLSVSAQLL